MVLRGGLRLPDEYRDLSFGGEVDAEFFPGDGQLRVWFYQGGWIRPNRNQFMLYDSGDMREWPTGPDRSQLAKHWFYVDYAGLKGIVPTT